MASCRNSTPSMRGMRWSASSSATLSLRTFSCFNRSSAPVGESLPMTRYAAPYWVRRSRSIARKTSESSSTLSKIGLGILGLGFGRIGDHGLLRFATCWIRYMKLHLVALLSLWAAVSAPAGDLSSDVPIRSPDVRYGSEGTRSSALVTNERGCSGCSSLLYSYGENVV